MRELATSEASPVPCAASANVSIDTRCRVHKSVTGRKSIIMNRSSGRRAQIEFLSIEGVADAGACSGFFRGRLIKKDKG